MTKTSSDTPQRSESMEEPFYPLSPEDIARDLYVSGVTAQIAQDFGNQAWNEAHAVKHIKAYAQQLAREAERKARINTKCPACRMTSLIIASGGYIVCGNLECSDPDAINGLAELQQEKQ